MRHTKSSRLIPLLVAPALLAAPAIASAERIQADLSGYDEVPAVSTVAAGDFRAMISPQGDAIDYELTYAGLQGDVVMAHVHLAQPGVNGAVMFWLCGTPAVPGPDGTPTCPTDGTVTGTVMADDIQAAPDQQLAEGDLAAAIAAIRARVAYVNVHTTLSPGGEIRGPIRASRRR